jgi:anti-anti-sigma factor
VAVLDYEVTERTGDEARIRLHGELSGDVPVERLKKDLEHHFVNDGVRVIRVDLSDVEMIDLEGVSTLLVLWRESEKRDKRLVVVGASGQVREKIALTGLTRLLEDR